jgi:hypothetical protein
VEYDQFFEFLLVHGMQYIALLLQCKVYNMASVLFFLMSPFASFSIPSVIPHHRGV